jgi:ATP-binding cassette subfamily G (WHITE) protein 2 (SNQ2)
VCTLAGSQPGSATVSGVAYLKNFGYEPSHLWRNFGVVIAFAVLYILVAMIGVEYMDWGAGGGSVKLLTKPPKVLSEELPVTEDKAQTTTTTTALQSEDPEKSMEIARKISTVKTKGSIFTWRNVNYTIGEAQLLHNVHGYCKPGRLTALMGPSGAGKTTLLDNLGLRKRVGITSGELRMDGKDLMPDFGRSTAFVEQQDVHDELSTVREAMRFSALLRQPASVSVEEKYKFVDQIIELLELEPLANAIIGSPGFGLSVEERKRVTIGVELAAAPSELLFLDEPT